MARGSSSKDKSGRTPTGSTGSDAGARASGSPVRREVAGILLLALALFVALSLGSLQAGGRLMGPGGALVALAFYAVIGVGAWVVAIALGVSAVRMIAGRPMHLRSWEAAGYVAAALFAAQLLHLAAGHYRLRGYSAGGLCGEYGAELMVALLGTVGAVLVSVTGLLLALMATTPITASGIVRALARASRGTWSGFSQLALATFPTRRGTDEDDDGQGESPSHLDPDATRPVPALPSRAAAGRERAAAAPVVVVAADGAGDTRRTRVVPPPADDTPMVAAATSFDPRGRRRKGREGAPDVAVQHEATTRQHDTSSTPAGTSTVDAAMQQAGDAAHRAPATTQNLLAATAAVSTVAAGTAGTAAAVEETAAPIALSGAAADPVPVINLPPRRTASGKAAPATTAVPGTTTEAGLTAPQPAPHPAPQPVDIECDRTDVSVAPPSMLAEPEATAAPTIVAPLERRPPGGRAPLDYIRLGSGEYRLPELALLDYDEAAHTEIDRQSMLDLAGRLEKTLADYGVKGRVSEIHPGPVVTMYEFVPQAGTKLSKITALSNDLAMALEALKVRIVAPIPGKAAVGIEVPNRVRETVFLKEIIGSDTFARHARSKLAMALGKDIVGNPVVVDLAKMPHLLIAGTTGSGKSVSVNAMICSLLFNASPDEVKMIMIDPKMLELSIYEGIPHLLLPVVTDPKKANLALRWAVEEMERRYDLISRSGVRDIASYNKKVEKRAGEHEVERRKPVEPPRPTVTVMMGEGAARREVTVEATVEAVQAAGGVVDSQILDDISASVATAHAAAVQQMELLAAEPERKLPYIVIVIDEFADLMMVASKEVEQSVARIAQKARAAGIHLMLATQRPSVDVITGLIKANFPSRIAFQVASRIDARTILDQQGAESLLGMGDMLFTDRGLALRRVHGPLVTDGEIHRVVEVLRAQGKPVYDLDILKPRAEDGEDGGPAEEDMSDEMYDQAVAIVGEMRQASTSMLQRRLRLGYNRAARMIERMEREGIVGPADGARPREVLVRSHAA